MEQRCLSSGLCLSSEPCLSFEIFWNGPLPIDVVTYLVERFSLVLEDTPFRLHFYDANFVIPLLSERGVVSLPCLIWLDEFNFPGVLGNPLVDRLSSQVLESLLMIVASKVLVLKAANLKARKP